MELDNYEKKVILALQKDEKQSIEELAKNTALKEDAIRHSTARLSTTGLVKIDESISEKLELGKEGKQYLEKGLPERLVLEEIKDKEISIKELNEKLSADIVKIATVWLRKLNIAMILDGKIQITPAGKNFISEKMVHEQLLTLIAENKQIPDNLKHELDDLKKRGSILKSLEKKHYEVRLTDKGKELLNKGIKIEDEISVLTPKLIKSGKWKTTKLRKYNIDMPVPELSIGKKQMYKAFLDEVKDLLIGMGFKEVKGPIVETEFWNFDALYISQKHPARMANDFYILDKPRYGELPDRELVDRVKQTHENGWKTNSTGRQYTWDEARSKQLMLRAHTTPVSAREMWKGLKLPARLFSIGRCFRRDIVGKKHLPEFNHCEGIVADESLTFRDLLGCLKSFAIEIANTDKIKFKPAYFPYTEPSAELFAKHPVLGWIELGGSGMFRPEMRKPLGVEAPMLAWGLGIDRLAMFKLGLDDIRELYSKKLTTLESAVL